MTDSSPPSDYDRALAFLHQRINYERTALPYRSRGLKLDRMRRLLDLLGDPHLRVPCVHIAGTKGKGSTAVMIATVLTRAGYRTGLYTSPHLERVEERIAVDGQPCSPEEFAARLFAVRDAVEQLDREAATTPEDPHGPTFFEIVTAMAFVHFAELQLDAAVIEVGLGGRLDSTNVCQPLVAVISSISFDHMKQLGNTLADIAAEKAGIIKPEVPTISGVTEPEPRDVIVRIAAERHSPLLQIERDFDFEIESAEHVTTAESVGFRSATAPAFAEQTPTLVRSPVLTLRDHARFPGVKPEALANVTLGMLGRHQAANAAVAFAVLKQLAHDGYEITATALREGLAAARCPARIEHWPGSPPVVLDAAHNVASIRALIQTLDEHFPDRPRTLVFAVSQDKDIVGMMPLLVASFSRLIFTRFIHNPRAVEPDELARLAHDVAPTAAINTFSTPHDAWHEARRVTAPDGLICVTGSFFLAAELRPTIVAN